MTLSARTKAIVGILTVWPIIYMACFVAFMFISVLTDLFSEDFVFDAFDLIFAIHLLTILEIFGLIAFYIVYIFKSDRVAADKKALWAVVIFLGHAIAMPVFFYLYICRKPEKGQEDVQGAGMNGT